MRRRVLLSQLSLLPLTALAENTTLSDVVGTLGQERSTAESGAALLKTYAKDDIEGRRLYAQAKAAFDGLIDTWLGDLAQNRDPEVTPAFRQRLDEAVTRRAAFSQHADQVIKATIPVNARPGLIDILGKVPGDVIKALFDGGIAIWREWHGASKQRREQIKQRLESERWRPFADIAPAG